MTVLRNDNSANVMLDAARAALDSMKPDKDIWGQDEEIYLGNVGVTFTMASGKEFQPIVKIGDVDAHGVVVIEYGGHNGSLRALIAADEIAAVSFIKDPQ